VSFTIAIAANIVRAPLASLDIPVLEQERSIRGQVLAA
jgi:hypothetical protein